MLGAAAGLAHIIGNSISDGCRHPTFDLIATLKYRRLKWARQELALHTQHGERPTARGLIFDARSMLAVGGYKKGFVLGDAPAHSTIEELLEMSWEDWNESINKLDTRTKAAAEKDADKCSKTGKWLVGWSFVTRKMERA